VTARRLARDEKENGARRLARDGHRYQTELFSFEIEQARNFELDPDALPLSYPLKTKTVKVASGMGFEPTTSV